MESAFVMEKEAIPQIFDDRKLSADERRTEADEILEALKCVCMDEFLPRERGFVESMEDVEFVTQPQLDWLRKIRDRKKIL